MKKIIVLAALMFLVPLAIAIETPEFTVEFRGIAKINGEPAEGAMISVWDGDLMMDETVAGYGIGYYNHLEIKWDDPLTQIDEGLDSGSEAIFKINGQVAESFTVSKSQGGQTVDLDLDVRIEEPAEIKPRFGMFLIFIGLILLIIVIIIFAHKIKNER